MIDVKLALMCGTDIPVPECQLSIHQPSISEISFIGEKDFFAGAQCLCLYKTMFIQDKTLLSDITNFQIFMTIMQEKQASDKKEAVQKVLTILFPTMNVMFTPKSLLFKSIDNPEAEIIIIDENNFEILQEYLREIFCMQSGPADQRSYNPAGKKAQEIAKKLMRGRERVATEKNSNNTSIFSQYMSILSIGVGYNLKDLIKLTMFQLYDLIERYNLWVNWDIDVRIRIGGGKPDDKPDNWMKNIH